MDILITVEQAEELTRRMVVVQEWVRREYERGCSGQGVALRTARQDVTTR